MMETTEAMVITAYDSAREAARRTEQAARLLISSPPHSKLERQRDLEVAVAAETYAWSVLVAVVRDSDDDSVRSGPDHLDDEARHATSPSAYATQDHRRS